jgi:hypothetical protein
MTLYEDGLCHFAPCLLSRALIDSAAPGDSLVSVGRDITLSRKPKGRFALNR